MRRTTARKPHRSLQTHGRDADALRERLRARFTHAHAVVGEFELVDTAVLEFGRALGRLRNGPPSDGSPVAQYSIGTLVDKTRGELRDEREAFDARRVSFLDEAPRSVVVERPPAARGRRRAR